MATSKSSAAMKLDAPEDRLIAAIEQKRREQTAA
jgi:hypothetical protein